MADRQPEKRNGNVHEFRPRAEALDEDAHPIAEALLHEIPPAVWLIAVPMAIIELMAQAASYGFIDGSRGTGWRMAMLQKFALAPDMLGRMWASGIWPADYLMRFVTYAFFHVNFLHAAMVIVFVLALGKFVTEAFGALAMLAIFFVATIVGGVGYSLVPVAQAGLIGGYPGVYGLIGGFTAILWSRLGAAHANQYRAFTLIGFLLGIQLVYGLLLGTSWDWVAELAGFGAGFGLSFLVAPGGPAELVRRIRRR